MKTTIRAFGLLVAAGILSLAACGGSDGDDAGTDLVRPDVPAGEVSDPGAPEDPGVEVRDEGPAEVGPETFDAPDEGRDGATEDAADVPETVCPGGYLCSCNSGGECYSGFCVDSGDGKVCTKQCNGADSCLAGWSCEQVAASPDVIFACVNLQTSLCKPCKADSDCAPALGAGSQRFVCIGYGDEGSFCGTPCATSDDCPDDYGCETVGEGVSATKQCRLSTGTCPCTSAFQQGGFTTFCWVRSAPWACKGERTCATECDAPTPVAETCNKADDNCDGETDEGLDDLPCDLTNEWGTCQGATRCLAGKESCEGTKPAREACNGTNDDCDDETDEQDAVGCTKYYADIDGDKFGADGDFKCLCAMAYPYVTQQGGDCNDADADSRPGANEICNGKDDNCNGQTDEVGALNCSPFYRDDDTDGYGIEANSKCLCAPEAPYTAKKIGDCNDGDALVRPNAAESCNGVDDNCANGVDEDGAEGCKTVYQDNDRDGFGQSAKMACKCVPASPFDAAAGGDCNDDDVTVKPGATEVCNGKDDDCNGKTDEPGAQGCSTYWLDLDGDTYGQNTTQCGCGPDSGTKYTAVRGGDCNDGDSTMNPGLTELCNFKDDDCNGTVDDPNASGCRNYYVDVDKDSWGAFSSGLCICAPDDVSSRTATKEGDCDDNSKLLNPDIAEKCDGIDNNCNGAIDEENATGCQVFYRDQDVDGFGVQAEAKCLCASAGQYTSQTVGDCCDADNRAYPGGGWQNSINACNSWDYDCSGGTDYEYGSANGGCDGWAVGSGCGLNIGWVGARAECGESKEYVYGGCGYGCVLWVCCEDPSKRTQLQRCR